MLNDILSQSTEYWPTAGKKDNPYSLLRQLTFSYLHSFQLRDISSSARRRAKMSSPGADFWLREPCEDDSCRDKGQLTFYCENCYCSFCDTCWDKQTPHKPKKRGFVGHAHEKIDRLVVERYRGIFEPPSSTDEQDASNKNEEDATWFGIGHNPAGDPVFEDYGQYTTLMAESLLPTPKVRYPHLVSFIGQTGKSSQPCLLFFNFFKPIIGAGKSAVIKLLINY